MIDSLYEDHAKAVWQFLLRRTPDRMVAEDLLQETFARALRDDQTPHRNHEHQRAWLMVVARNLTIDRLRSAAHRHEQATDEVFDEGQESHDDLVLDRWLMTDALASLSDAHRQVIVRAYYQDRSVTQIAETLGLAPGTVKSRMHHGMKALRLALQERGVTS